MAPIEKNERGLFVMLITIIVIAILALIVIPRLLNAGRSKDQEDQLRLRLQIIRAGITQFKDDCGDYPASLMWLLEKPTVWKSDGTPNHSLPGWKGPYLHSGVLPIDPFTRKTDWNYNPLKGEVHSTCNLTAYDGTPYNLW